MRTRTGRPQAAKKAKKKKHTKPKQIRQQANPAKSKAKSQKPSQNTRNPIHHPPRRVEQSNPQSNVQTTTTSQTFVDLFFARPEYSRFRYNPYLTFTPQFNRMADELGWNEHGQLWARAYEDLLDALVSQFNFYYGMDSNSLKSWEDLCRAIKISPIPSAMKKAREVVTGTYVGVIDLIEHKRIGMQVPVFANASQLENYMKVTRKYFPSTHPKAGGVLRCLLSSLPAVNIHSGPNPLSPSMTSVSSLVSGSNSGSSLSLNPNSNQKPDSHIIRFFTQRRYARYRYDPSRPIMDQYFALQDLYGWKRSDFASDEAWEGIREALVLQFNSYFGEDAESLGPWEDLCGLIGLKPIPKTVEDCRKMVTSLNINIVDLIESRRNGEKVTIFANVERLSEYTIQKKRYFPRDHAKAGGVLQALLRHILNPSLDRMRNRIPTKRGTRRS